MLQIASGRAWAAPAAFVRVESDGTKTSLITGLESPASLVFDADAVYVSNRSTSAGNGEVLRFELPSSPFRRRRRRRLPPHLHTTAATTAAAASSTAPSGSSTSTSASDLSPDLRRAEADRAQAGNGSLRGLSREVLRSAASVWGERSRGASAR